jgi:hypothetical protein
MDKLQKEINTIEPYESLMKDVRKLIGLYEKRNNVKWFYQQTILKVSYDKKAIKEKTTVK